MVLVMWRVGSLPFSVTLLAMDVPIDRFEQLVGDALDALPEALGQLMDNVVIFVDDAAPEPGLLGLYEGIPLTERDDYGGMELPDRITLYRRELCAMCGPTKSWCTR